MESFKRNILIVVAHPDDETMWFFSGLKHLSQIYNVDLLCLTYTKSSLRGRELLKANEHYKINLLFGNLVDSGVKFPILHIENKIDETIQENVYDFIITHPPYGVSKTHPHHRQCFHICRRLAHQHKINFGFFSETDNYKFNPVRNARLLLQYGRFLFTNTKYPLHHFKEFYKEFCFFLFRCSWIKRFNLISFDSDIEKKQQTLSYYKSQPISLVQYKQAVSAKEYLYLQTEKDDFYMDLLKRKSLAVLMITVLNFLILSCAGIHDDSSPVPAAPSKAPAGQPSSLHDDLFKNKVIGYTCRHGEDVRSIWIEKLDPKGCKLWYSNYGKEGPTASSSVSLEHCYNVTDNIKHNLAAANYQCVVDPKNKNADL
ncbi:MAG: PIG-L family deacetylase [Pseudobdellovibrio sp.]